MRNHAVALLVSPLLSSSFHLAPPLGAARRTAPTSVALQLGPFGPQYTNTENRFAATPGQKKRKRKLEAYINNEAGLEPADKRPVIFIAGLFFLSLVLGLGGAAFYYSPAYVSDGVVNSPRPTDWMAEPQPARDVMDVLEAKEGNPWSN